MASLNQVGGNATSSAKVSDINAVITALNALDARLAALEKTYAAHIAEVASRDAFARIEELTSFEKETRALADLNKEALRAIFTVFHPEPVGHGDFALVATESQHTLLHQWLDKLGGRAELPSDTKVR